MCVGCDCWKAEMVQRRRKALIQIKYMEKQLEAERWKAKQKQKLSYKIKQWLINKWKKHKRRK